MVISRIKDLILMSRCSTLGVKEDRSDMMTSYWVFMAMLMFGTETWIPCRCSTLLQQTSNGDQSTNPQVVSQLEGLKNAVSEFCEEVIRQMKITEARLQSIVSEIDAAIENYESGSKLPSSSMKPQLSETSQPNVSTFLRPQGISQNAHQSSTSLFQNLNPQSYNIQQSSAYGNQVETSYQNSHNSQLPQILGNQPLTSNQQTPFNIQQSPISSNQPLSLSQPYNIQQTSNLNYPQTFTKVPNKIKQFGMLMNGPSVDHLFSNIPPLPMTIQSYRPQVPYNAPTYTLPSQTDGIPQSMLSVQPSSNYPQSSDIIKNPYVPVKTKNPFGLDYLKNPAFMPKEEFPFQIYQLTQPSLKPYGFSSLSTFRPQNYPI